MAKGEEIHVYWAPTVCQMQVIYPQVHLGFLWDGPVFLLGRREVEAQKG